MAGDPLAGYRTRGAGRLKAERHRLRVAETRMKINESFGTNRGVRAMAKKYRSSMRVHGLQPVSSRAIRWLGAYGHGTSIESIAEFELNPRREVSCEIIPEGKGSHIRHARVGLMIDQGRTHLVAGYAGDAMTRDNRIKDELGEALPRRLRPFSTDWKTVGGLYKEARRNGESYIEGVVAGPKYSAIILKTGSRESAATFATRLSCLMELPVIELPI